MDHRPRAELDRRLAQALRLSLEPHDPLTRERLAQLIEELELTCEKFEISKQRQLEREARRGDLRMTALQLHKTEGKLSLSRR